MVIPSTPALPLFAWTRLPRLLQILSFAYLLHQRSSIAGLSGSRFAAGGSVPSRTASRGFTPTLRHEGQCIASWIFCRLPLMSCASYLPSQSFRPSPSFPVRRLFLRLSGRVPQSARRLHCLLCPLLTSAPRSGCLTASSVSNFGTQRRSPEVSSTAFPAHPPDLQPWPLMDMDFAV